MDYNTSLDKIMIKEYGRNIQKMIEHTITIEDKEKRTRLAKAIIKVMSQLNPNGKDSSDYWHKLWDHLFFMSNFKLDIDSPYEKPDELAIQKRPDPLPYPKNKIKFPPYGKNIEIMIAKAIGFEEGAEKDMFISEIANHLKKQYLSWNRDSVNDELIAEHLKVLSEGKLVLREDFKFANTRDILIQNQQIVASMNKNKPQKKKMNKNIKPGKTFFKKKQDR